ncbi:MAG: aldehyde dehydrogenase (NADP(+)) [Chitinophagaceae bacterium]
MDLKMKINAVVAEAFNAYPHFANTLPAQRAALMHAIAKALRANKTKLISVAAKETHLPPARLKTELDRTILQWNQYADACTSGKWLHISKDLSGPTPILKMNRALGPVVVFGASNFPFAYSTPGGDTATALAAGCPVIVKAHPAHPETASACARLIHGVIEKEGFPANIFQHVPDEGFETGTLLVQHPLTAAVAFTGSFSGGKALYDHAQARKNPIPVFAEMGSVNPVVILPEAQKEAKMLSVELVHSLTASAGQFCTNPGVWLIPQTEHTPNLLSALKKALNECANEPMLHEGIAKSFRTKRKEALASGQVELLASSEMPDNDLYSIPTISTSSAKNFIANPMLREEIFGPYALAVLCENMQELAEALEAMDGQLTGTIRATAGDEKQLSLVVPILERKCGRLVFNGVPTGVTVTAAMHHGGPFPATTDSRFTAVGADAICRFVRPVCYQGWPAHLLPETLQSFIST